MSLRPICANCSLFYKPYRNGVYFTENMPTGRKEWKPYKIWSGDLWICKGCGNQIIVGVGKNPLREHYEDQFEELRKRTGADEININDC